MIFLAFAFKVTILYIFGVKCIYKWQFPLAFAFKVMVLHIFAAKCMLK